MEATARNIDRLVTIEMRWGGRGDRGIIAPLYESACRKVGGKPVSLVAAQSIIKVVSKGDRIILVTDFASYPNMPYGETDGPLGVASLARAIRFGLDVVPVIVTGNRAIESVRYSVKAAGLNIMEYSEAAATTSWAATTVIFPSADGEESRKIAAAMLEKYTPKAIISVETVGPNKKGVKHFGAGADTEAKDKLPKLEYLFYEASARGILTIGVIDQGNELGSGTIEESVRAITPYADVCRCPCRSGIACNVKADIVFPAAISNWGAYGISAMLAFLLKKPEALQDIYTERRMLEACTMAGAVDGLQGGAVMSVDGVSHEIQEALVTMLHGVIGNALKDLKVDRFTRS